MGGSATVELKGQKLIDIYAANSAELLLFVFVCFVFTFLLVLSLCFISISLL